MNEKIKNILKRNDVNVVIATLILFIIFSLGSESFLSSYNLFNVTRTSSLYIFIALGQVIVLIVGGMNLSLGSIGGLSVITSGIIMHTLGMNPILAVIMALLIGVIAGLLNGILIVKLKLNSFVVTLATSFIFTGLVLGISKGFPYTNIPKIFTYVGRKGIGGVPILFILAIITLCVIGYIFKYTLLGRRLLATGGNETAARLSGIKTDSMIVMANMLSGFFAALAGVLFVSRMGTATPSTGTDWMIISFAVAVIGGTSLNGGEVKPLGLLASGIMMALIKNGLIMLNVNVYFEQTFLGLIILLAVALETLRGNIKVFEFMKAKKEVTKTTEESKLSENKA